LRRSAGVRLATNSVGFLILITSIMGLLVTLVIFTVSREMTFASAPAVQPTAETIYVTATAPLVATAPPVAAAPPEPAVVEQVEAPAAPTAAPAPTESLASVEQGEVGVIYTDPLDKLYDDHFRRIERLIGLRNDPYLRLVVRPLDHPSGRPDLILDFDGDKIQNAASTLKAGVLIYAIFRDPRIALTGWESGDARDAYKMIVGSNNTATGAVLVDASGVAGNPNALNHFNDFLHDIIGLPPYVGLTQWNYGATTGMISTHLSAVDPTYDPDEVQANPVTLNALLDLFEFLESPGWIEGAINRALNQPGYPLTDEYSSPELYRQGVLAALDEARALMAIPDPEQTTELETALARAQARYPDVSMSMYGKNGTLRPGDWPPDRWHVIEAVTVTLEQGEHTQRCSIAYAASHFDNERVLDAAFDYCVGILLEAAAGD
jgi:hypothetical protein